MKFEFNKLSIKHGNYPESVLNTKVIDLLCSRVCSLGIKEKRLLEEYKKTGFQYARLNKQEVQLFDDVRYTDKGDKLSISDSEPLTIMRITYGGNKKEYLWCDGFCLRKLLLYVKIYGKGITLRDLPIVLVDLVGDEDITVYGEHKCVMGDFNSIGILAQKAQKCLKYTDTKKIRSIHYTIKDFIKSNKELLSGC